MPKRNITFGSSPTVLVDNGIWPGVLSGIMARAMELGVTIVDLHIASEHDFWKSNILGVISNLSRRLGDMKQFSLSDDVPIVGLSFDVNQSEPNLYLVRDDLREVGELACRHLFDLGIRSMAYIAYEPWGNLKEAYEGFHDQAERLNCSFHLFQYRYKFADTVNSDRSSPFGSWLERIPKPVGFLVAQDRYGASLCKTCLELGWRVPEDVAILGVGNKRFFCESSPVPLSSVGFDEELRGRLAVDTLFDIAVANRVAPKLRLVSPLGITVRRSTVLETLVPKVLRFMRENLSIDMSVGDIADEFGVSRRKVERAFRKELNSSINKELVRLRIERCCNLLETTDLNVGELTKLVGFSSQTYLQTVFRYRMGMTPIEYRNRNTK